LTPVFDRRTRFWKEVIVTVEVRVRDYPVDWSSVAYLYLDRPQHGLPPLAPVDSRLAGR